MARSVRIDAEVVRRWAAHVTPSELRPTGHDLLTQLPGDRGQLANLILLIESLNFCFWGDPPPTYTRDGITRRGFNAMFAAVLDGLRREPRWLDASFWCDAPAAEVRALIAPTFTLPLMHERERIIWDTGRTLMDRFDGQFENAVESVNGRAWDLAALLLTSFDSFRDVAAYRGRAVYIAKRAQITPADLSTAWESHGHESLVGLDALTAFADYRLPQALRHLGIVIVDDSLAGAIERRELLPAGGEAEVELRAATIWAVEDMRAALAARGMQVPAWQIDWYLWNRSHDADVAVAHHRTQTVYY